MSSRWKDMKGMKYITCLHSRQCSMERVDYCTSISHLCTKFHITRRGSAGEMGRYISVLTALSIVSHVPKKSGNSSGLLL